MITIKIGQFIGYDEKGIGEYLKMQTEKRFEITLPKVHTPDSRESWLVHWEYCNAAYIGQQLSEIGIDFYYKVPDVNAESEFVFRISKPKRRALSKIIHFAIKIFYSADLKDAVLQKRSEAFFDRAYDDDGMNEACWGLLDMANHCLE